MTLPGVRRVSGEDGSMDESTLSNLLSIEADVLRLHATNPGTHYNRIGARQGTDGFMDQGGVSVFTV